jgi:hypothetical protein
MAEALKHYHDRETMAMARYISRMAVKDEINRKGLKLREFSAKQITELGDEYLHDHRDVVMKQALAWTWEKEVVAALRHYAQKLKARKSMASAVQILGAK